IMSTTDRTDSCSAALFGKTRRAILALLYGHPDESYYLREVVRSASSGQGAVQRELQRLTEGGILRRVLRGRHVYYEANRQCPIFHELHGLVVKTVGVADVVREALGGLQNQIKIAFLFGSIARGEARPGSDVDLLVVGAPSFGDVVAALAPAQERLGRDLNPTVYPVAEFRRKMGEGHHFLRTVLQGPKVFLVGDEHELARLAQGRLVDGAHDQPARNRRPPRRGRS